MDSLKFEQCNLVLKANGIKNTNDLHAATCVEPKNNQPFIFAKFKLSKEELERINETGELFVGIMGRSWPPVLPTVYNPFEELGFIQKKGGLPECKYRDEIEEMLKGIYYDGDWMTDKFWGDFVNFMGEKFNFVQFSEQLERGLVNGHLISEQLKECERVMRKIMSKEQMLKFREN